MNHTDLKSLQAQIQNSVLNILKNSDSVLGIINTGSIVQNENDAFSDIDIECFMSDEGKTEIGNLLEKVAKISPLLSKLWIYDKNGLFLFENGVRLDLNFYKPSEISSFNKHLVKILYDPKDVVTRDLNKSTVAEEYQHPRWNPSEFEYLDWYFWMFRQVYCWTKRGQQITYKSFDKLNIAIDSLSKIREGLIGIRLWLYGTRYYLTRVDADFADRLQKTYPHFEPEEILKCTRLLLEEFKQLAKPYCKKRNIEYPTYKIKIMKEMLDAFDAIE
jgi:predicted nucleotidyltransferase